MTYKNIVKGKFLSRPNRFIAYAEIDGKEEICHVKNTGRCKELLVPGAEIYLEKAPEGSSRKTGYDLIAVQKGEMLVNIDSNAPNAVVFEYLCVLYGRKARILPEKKYGDSRFDFYVERGGERHFIEVKGVTLEEGGIVRFPDAPTLRGTKHLRELRSALKEGYAASVFFVIQMAGMKGFLPNDQTDPSFGRELRAAREAGVEICAFECAVTPESLQIIKPIPLLF